MDGRAVGGDNVISVTRSGNGLRGEGEAYWPGADPPEDQFPGGPNLGAFDSIGRPHSHAVVFTDTDDECSVSAHLVGDVLVVNDNHQCGGMNVTFDGVYEREKPGN